MNKQDFINLLFDFGQGLTLDQIAKFDDDFFLDEVPEGIIEGYMEVGNDESTAVGLAIMDARKMWLETVSDNYTDLLALRAYFDGFGFSLSDMQVFHLYNVLGRIERG